MNHKSAAILIVDDDDASIDLVRRVLDPDGYTNIETTTNPAEVDAMCKRRAPDLVLLDYRMPHMNGIEVLDALRERFPGPALPPVVMLTADDTRDVKRAAFEAGARDFLSKPLSPYEVRLRVANLLENRALQRELLDQNESLEERVRIRTRELEEARIQILERLAIAAEYHDPQTGEHTRRVSETSARLAERCGFTPVEVELIRRAAPLHDVGKVGVPTSILLKPGALSREEHETMQAHTKIGRKILSGSGIPLLDLAAEIAYSHHEHWDGSGYPCGVRGEEIPTAARIVAVADVFDSLVNQRPYKPAWEQDQALDFMRKNRGRQFDPEIVDALVELVGVGR